MMNYKIFSFSIRHRLMTKPRVSSVGDTEFAFPRTRFYTHLFIIIMQDDKNNYCFNQTAK